PDPLVAASLRAALAADAQLELREAGEQGLLVYDLGPERAQARARLAALAVRREPTLVLLAHPDDATPALAAGAEGVMLRELDGPKLCAALKAIAHGLQVLDAALVPRSARSDARDRAPPEALTPRELEVLRLIADGLSNKRIGRELDISEHTAKFHVN